MPEDSSEPPFRTFIRSIGSIVDVPVTYFRESILDPIRSKNKHYYYHRRYRRVPTIDECDINDSICYYEANEQFKRDKNVDDEILAILRQRRIECEIYYEHQAPKHCEQLKKDYFEAEANWFTKYGDLGFRMDVREAYMKQKHRMIWERRHGPVGSGMKTEEQQ
ncbi:hypothetical protein HELRODRAFT_77448 [Helobdella robusta]|uniref:NADH dehydrogenase [ubiquinone] 1 beta subcomplex subunit 10 n=1 Tax=Helobdella robusta TaxID=6412 RepID=T1G2X9_HELRO|nr:hypothetical protein HELRODRAFT_77448 [Helobdella robusta]ESO05590.1 hypothetical protein HELRODRAFT_77448 [Helobdella robusta]